MTGHERIDFGIIVLIFGVLYGVYVFSFNTWNPCIHHEIMLQCHVFLDFNEPGLCASHGPLALPILCVLNIHTGSLWLLQQRLRPLRRCPPPRGTRRRGHHLTPLRSCLHLSPRYCGQSHLPHPRWNVAKSHLGRYVPTPLTRAFIFLTSLGVCFRPQTKRTTRPPSSSSWPSSARAPSLSSP